MLMMTMILLCKHRGGKIKTGCRMVVNNLIHIELDLSECYVVNASDLHPILPATSSLEMKFGLLTRGCKPLIELCDNVGHMENYKLDTTTLNSIRN